MSAERFVDDARRSLATLLGTGAVSAGPEASKGFAGLATRARGLGLADLGRLLDEVGKLLEGRAAFAYEPSPALASAVLEVSDRVEALASALRMFALEERYLHDTPKGQPQ